MRIVFIGSVAFSERALQHILGLGGEVVGVCTVRQSVFNSDHADLVPTCDRAGIPWRETADINSPDAIAWVRGLAPDVIFCFGWSRLLKSEILELAPLGVVGYHPAALPANRGRHPLIWALALGLEQTASTFFFMDTGADSGDILSQASIAITEADDAATLYEKMTQTALAQIGDFLPRLADGSFARVRQDHAHATSWRKRGRADGLIDWRMSARTIHNLVRALARPYVGASFVHRDVEYKVWTSRIVSGLPENAEPGKIMAVEGGGPVVKCGENGVCLLNVDPPIDLEPGSYV